MSYRMGSGKDRKSWRIIEWLKEKKLSVGGIADELGVDHSLVSHTIHGRRNSRVVLAKLKAYGCPSNILSLPADLKEAA